MQSATPSLCFPASDPSKVEVLHTGGHSGKGMAIDSQGNARIANTMGSGLDLAVKAKLLELKLTGQMGQFHRVVFDYFERKLIAGQHFDVASRRDPGAGLAIPWRRQLGLLGGCYRR